MEEPPRKRVCMKPDDEPFEDAYRENGPQEEDTEEQEGVAMEEEEEKEEEEEDEKEEANFLAMLMEDSLDDQSMGPDYTFAEDVDMDSNASDLYPPFTTGGRMPRVAQDLVSDGNVRRNRYKKVSRRFAGLGSEIRTLGPKSAHTMGWIDIQLPEVARDALGQESCGVAVEGLPPLEVEIWPFHRIGYFNLEIVQEIQKKRALMTDKMMSLYDQRNMDPVPYRRRQVLKASSTRRMLGVLAPVFGVRLSAVLGHIVMMSGVRLKPTKVTHMLVRTLAMYDHVYPSVLPDSELDLKSPTSERRLMATKCKLRHFFPPLPAFFSVSPDDPDDDKMTIQERIVPLVLVPLLLSVWTGPLMRMTKKRVYVNKRAMYQEACFEACFSFLFSVTREKWFMERMVAITPTCGDVIRREMANMLGVAEICMRYATSTLEVAPCITNRDGEIIGGLGEPEWICLNPEGYRRALSEFFCRVQVRQYTVVRLAVLLGSVQTAFKNPHLFDFAKFEEGTAPLDDVGSAAAREMALMIIHFFIRMTAAIHARALRIKIDDAHRAICEALFNLEDHIASNFTRYEMLAHGIYVAAVSRVNFFKNMGAPSAEREKAYHRYISDRYVQIDDLDVGKGPKDRFTGISRAMKQCLNPGMVSDTVLLGGHRRVMDMARRMVHLFGTHNVIRFVRRYRDNIDDMVTPAAVRDADRTTCAKLWYDSTIEEQILSILISERDPLNFIREYEEIKKRSAPAFG